jgi:hypothetical protein
MVPMVLSIMFRRLLRNYEAATFQMYRCKIMFRWTNFGMEHKVYQICMSGQVLVNECLYINK